MDLTMSQDNIRITKDKVRVLIRSNYEVVKKMFFSSFLKDKNTLYYDYSLAELNCALLETYDFLIIDNWRQNASHLSCSMKEWLQQVPTNVIIFESDFAEKELDELNNYYLVDISDRNEFLAIIDAVQYKRTSGFISIYDGYNGL